MGTFSVCGDLHRRVQDWLGLGGLPMGTSQDWPFRRTPHGDFICLCLLSLPMGSIYTCNVSNEGCPWGTFIPSYPWVMLTHAICVRKGAHGGYLQLNAHGQY